MGRFYVLTWNCNPSLLLDSNVTPVAGQADPVLGLRYQILNDWDETI